MSQLTIYLPEDLYKKVIIAAKAKKISTSKWVSEILANEVDENWPEEIKAMAGSWPDFPSQDEIRKTLIEDSPRERF